jgi:polyisoprenoid-binding protein YceI
VGTTFENTQAPSRPHFNRLKTALCASFLVFGLLAAPAWAEKTAKTKTEASKADAASQAGVPHEVDAVHSNVDFKIRHFFSKVSGRFKEFEGTFSFDEGKKTVSDVKFTIQAKSVDTDNAKRDEHLRNEDFFHVEKFPTITFVSASPSGADEKAGKADKKAAKAKTGKASEKAEATQKFALAGEMELHGIKKPVVFEVEYLGTEPTTKKSGFVATTTIDRKDFGITWNKTLDSGSVVLGEKVEISIQIEAAPKPPAKQAQASTTTPSS